MEFTAFTLVQKLEPQYRTSTSIGNKSTIKTLIISDREGILQTIDEENLVLKQAYNKKRSAA